MKHILFVCTGNTCRSPLAEYLFKHKAGERYTVQSAGIAALEGGPVAEHVQQLLNKQGIPHHHQSQNISPELVEWADLILTMTESHRMMLLDRFPHKKESIYTLKQFVNPESDELNVSDPFGGSIDIYQQTMTEIERLIDDVLQKMNNE